MASSSQKRNITHMGKSPAEDVVVPPQPATRIEQVLDYKRYFSTRRQMVVFEKSFTQDQYYHKKLWILHFLLLQDLNSKMF